MDHQRSKINQTNAKYTICSSAGTFMTLPETITLTSGSASQRMSMWAKTMSWNFSISWSNSSNLNCNFQHHFHDDDDDDAQDTTVNWVDGSPVEGGFTNWFASGDEQQPVWAESSLLWLIMMMMMITMNMVDDDDDDDSLHPVWASSSSQFIFTSW